MNTSRHLTATEATGTTTTMPSSSQQHKFQAGTTSNTTIEETGRPLYIWFDVVLNPTKKHRFLYTSQGLIFFRQYVRSLAASYANTSPQNRLSFRIKSIVDFRNKFQRQFCRFVEEPHPHVLPETDLSTILLNTRQLFYNESRAFSAIAKAKAPIHSPRNKIKSDELGYMSPAKAKTPIHNATQLAIPVVTPTRNKTKSYALGSCLPSPIELKHMRTIWEMATNQTSIVFTDIIYHRHNVADPIQVYIGELSDQISCWVTGRVMSVSTNVPTNPSDPSDVEYLIEYGNMDDTEQETDWYNNSQVRTIDFNQNNYDDNSWSTQISYGMEQGPTKKKEEKDQ
jgi:hypothetical protein